MSIYIYMFFSTSQLARNIQTSSILFLLQHRSARCTLHLETSLPELSRQRCQVLQRLADLVVRLRVQTLLGLEISADPVLTSSASLMDSMDGFHGWI